MDISRHVAFLHSGIAIGVLPPDAAIGWADAIISTEPVNDIPPGIYDLSLAPRGDSTRVLDCLSTVAPVNAADESSIRALLDVLRRQLDRSTRTLDEVVRAAYILTRPLGSDSPVWADALILEDLYADARDGVFGTVEQVQSEVREWLEDFRGAADTFPSAA